MSVGPLIEQSRHGTSKHDWHLPESFVYSLYTSGSLALSKAGLRTKTHIKLHCILKSFPQEWSNTQGKAAGLAVHRDLASEDVVLNGQLCALTLGFVLDTELHPVSQDTQQFNELLQGLIKFLLHLNQAGCILLFTIMSHENNLRRADGKRCQGTRVY